MRWYLLQLICENTDTEFTLLIRGVSIDNAVTVLRTHFAAEGDKINEFDTPPQITLGGTIMWREDVIELVN